MPDDFSKGAITARLMRAGEVYANAGNDDGVRAVSEALAAVADAPSDEAARQIEIAFNRGTFPEPDDIDPGTPEAFDLGDPSVQLPGDPGDGDPGDPDADGGGGGDGDEGGGSSGGEGDAGDGGGESGGGGGGGAEGGGDEGGER